MLKNFRKIYFLPILVLNLLILPRFVSAIFFEFDNPLCILPFIILGFLPFVFLFICLILFFLVIDILFISKKKSFLKMFFIYIFSFFVAICFILYFSRGFIVYFAVSSGLDKEIFSFGEWFCYNHYETGE